MRRFGLNTTGILARAASVVVPWLLACSLPAFAEDAPKRPDIKTNRWQEDWSALANPALRMEWYDPIKYIPIQPGDPHSYVSFGMTLRERWSGWKREPFTSDSRKHVSVWEKPAA